ncbi:hypothetical protein H3N35_27170 [Thalassomonas haliotis]|uniref:Uncharacterized protein n=2 Tax=Thalassomonas haliotis TaxID=485448 RepID=A0ABY7VLK4_9GAMM|nr:hypothetical protein H3N35_27170 [Thalassomonas haliotis]
MPCKGGVPVPAGHATIYTEKALAPGPNYCQARIVDLGGRREIYLAGQTGNDPVYSEVVEGGIRAETIQALENIKEILLAAGATFDHVVKVTVFMTHMDQDKAVFEEVFGSYFPNLKPARSLVEVSKLPLPGENPRVEIEVFALMALENV